MSIFSSLFSREPEDDYLPDEARAEEASGQPGSAQTGELYQGMRLEVTDPEGNPLVVGRITALTPSTLTLERLPGGLGFKLCSLESAVCASGYDKKMIPISLRAAVQASSRTVLRLKSIQVQTHSENREAFRLPLSVPVSLYRWDDEHYKTPEECMLVDISTGGACVQSEYVHAEDEVLRMRLKLDDYTPMNFVAQIVRCVEHAPGKFRYGLLFAQLTEEEITSLNKVLFSLQTGVKRTHMRTEQGHW